MSKSLDTQSFVVAGTVEEPLDVQTFSAALEAQGIPVLVQERQGGSVDIITSPTQDFFELRVPEAQREKAWAILEEERRRQDAGAVEAAQAAEEESVGPEGSGRA